MKKTTFLTAFVTFNLIVFYIIYINYPTRVDLLCPLAQEPYEISLGVLILILVFTSEVIGMMYTIALRMNLTKMFNAYQKRNESISVKHEESTDRVKALEAKIETLETALKSALDNK